MSDASTSTRTIERPGRAPTSGRTVKISTRYGKLTPAQVRRAVESVSPDKR